MTPLDYKLYFHRRLPHYQPPGAMLFVTFRLTGSLPRETIERLGAEVRQKEAELERMLDTPAKQRALYLAQRQLFGKWDAELDTWQYGPDWLSQPRIARMVCDALHYRDGKVYILDAFCVMPNHVHLVITPRIDSDDRVYSLSKIMHSLKGFTARRANHLLGRQGDFWQHESYDHVVRDNAEFQRIVTYVMENPSKAGLPLHWTYCRASQ